MQKFSGKEDLHALRKKCMNKKHVKATIKGRFACFAGKSKKVKACKSSPA